MSVIKRILKVILTIIILLILLFVLLIGYLSVREYKPAAEEPVMVNRVGDGEEAGMPVSGDTIRIVSWNTGYGALGETADFFMDGGTHVMTADKALVEENVSAIVRDLERFDADIVLLQETDRDSRRSHHIDEVSRITASLAEAAGTPESPGVVNWSFANNYLAPFVPFPVPPIGKVDSGILTVTSYPVTESVRISLPCPFS